MTVVGIVSEFDPFHNGHLHLLNEAKRITKAEYAVTVMSGSFTQRGDVSVISKSAKTECALSNGFDAVLELPVTFSVASAERFAFGAVSILNATGVVTHLAFGSECADVDKLTKVAKAVCEESTTDRIKELMKTGASFAFARETAVREKIGEDAELLSSPNDILGIEYIKALIKLESNIVPVAIKREGAMHGSDDVSGNIASATFIRRELRAGRDVSRFVPEGTRNVLNCVNIRSLDDRVILSRLRSMTAEEIARLPEIREGLENRICEEVRNASDIEGLVKNVACRRYTASSVRRILIYALLNIRAEDLPSSPEYIRLLGGRTESGFLKEIKKNARLVFITKTADFKEALETECRVSDVAATFEENGGMCREDYKKLPILTKYLTKSKKTS